MVQISGSISEILKELEQKFKSVSRSAVESATDSALQDIYKFSMSTIDRYYSNYEPERYIRAYDLYNTITPIEKISVGGDTIVSVVGVGFSGGAVGGKPGSSKYPGGADGNWIVENFLKGVHPITNGSPNPDSVYYSEIVDGISPDSLLKKYLQIRGVKIKTDIQNYIVMYGINKL
jgi:hypothetical protein